MAVVSVRAADDAPATDFQRKLQQIDLEVSFEQYKQIRMELFKTRMHAELLDTESGLSETELKAEQDRLARRIHKLQQMTDELRAQIAQLGSEITVAGK